MKTSRLNIADTRVAQHQGFCRTKANPSLISAIVCPSPCATTARVGRAVMKAIAVADTRKLDPSTTKAPPGPRPATTNPPIAGPSSRIMSGRTSPWNAFAWASRSSRTRSGTIAVAAGLKKASPRPTKAISATMCHSSIAPATDRMPRIPIAAARTRSAPIIIQRRSYRSEKTPPSSTNRISGRVQATPTIESAVGTLLIW